MTPEPLTSRLIGDARLARLLHDTEGDLDRAHELFSWNVRAAGASMEAIHVFELIFRNALDRELRTWNLEMQGTTEWLADPHPYLARSFYRPVVDKALASARRLAQEKDREVRHSDVLAQLPLGFWRYLLPSRANRSKQKLWNVALSRAFPAWVGDWTAESVVARVAHVHALRNRVAHLEPLHSFDLRRARRDMRSVCHAIGPDVAGFFVENERLLPVIESNPSHR